MSNYVVSEPNPWGLSWEKFFYYFMGLRKGELRKDIAVMKEQYPDEDAHQLARRIVDTQAPLSLLSGTLLQVPLLVPGISPVLKCVGIATGASVMVILNMTMLLQIALVFGHDLDDRARLKEMWAIIAASGLAGGAPLLPFLRTSKPYSRAMVGSAAVTTVSQLIGEAAIRYYGGAVVEELHVAPVRSENVSG